ncbi:cytochrome P450 [Imleria badia]|nr:cytochrome P450 [Imleria badia]
MSFHLPELPANITYGVVGIVAAITVIAKVSQGPNLDAIPAVGSSNWLGSWWAVLKYLKNAQNVIQEGYDKNKPAPFKVAEPNRWTVILSDRGHLEEVAKASNSELSFLAAINDQIQIEHTLGPEIHYNPYHVAVVRNHLTRNLEVLFPVIRDEIVTSFTEVLDLKENEWKSVTTLSVIEKIVCRTSNRAFVGLPLCRNPDWIDLNIQCTVDVMQGGTIIRLFPKFMRSLCTRLFTKVPQVITRGMKLLGPIIEERQKYLNEYKTAWDDKPNDLLSWLMDSEEAEGPELTAERLTSRVLMVNFAAIHTTSNSFAQALFYLAANPQYIQPLREEVEDIVEKDGWSKGALGKMRKIDSFLRECQRIEGISCISLARKALKDFTFSDGTFIPKGTSIAAATLPLHHDKTVYENPDVFEPFRFAHMCEEDGKGPKQQFASTSIEYLPFGHGRYACPGRFFAASELKLMLAHVVVTYDVKLEDNATYPPSWYIGTFITVDPHAKVVLRNRVE